MIRNYFPDLNIALPASTLHFYSEMVEEQKEQGLLFDEAEDITYEQKLKFSEDLSYLSS